MAEIKEYWNGLEDLDGNSNHPQVQSKEFAEELPLEGLTDEKLGTKSNRRDFLKVFGFGITAATLAACVETPVKMAIPMVNKPEDLMPGIANWYASTCGGCSAGCGILVKTREGRPIKVEGNPLSHSQGAVCAVGQATVLSLYDSERLKEPKGLGGAPLYGGGSHWLELDKVISGKLASLDKIRVVTNTINGPTFARLVKEFKTKYPNAEFISYDPVSYSAISKAHKRTHGKENIPSYHFDKADVIVGFNADFLATWLSPMQFTKDYSKGRKVNRDNPKMSWHGHFETRMSLTGSNADARFPIKPSEEGIAILNLYNAVAGLENKAKITGVKEASTAMANKIKDAAERLHSAHGKSLVVSGSNDANVQEVVAALNDMLGNYGQTIDIMNPTFVKSGDESKWAQLMTDLAVKNSGVIFVNCNPVYDTNDGAKLAGLIKGATLSVSITTKVDETSDVCAYSIPAHHFLESWNDHNPSAGFYTLTQPSIRPIFDTRQAEETLLSWAGNPSTWYDYMKLEWKENLYPTQQQHATFEDFWNQSVHDGVFKGTYAPAVTEVTTSSDLKLASEGIGKYSVGTGKMEVMIYQKVAMTDGRHANNPWLQELPDPVTKVTWENYVSIPYKYSKDNNLRDGDLVNLKVGSVTLKLPVVVQPGQAPGTLAVALGYGRTKGGKVANGIGANAFPIVRSVLGEFHYNNAGDIISTGEYNELAKTQTFIGYELADGDGTTGRTSIEGRVKDYILKETTLDDYKKSKVAGNKRPSKDEMVTLWKEHKKEGYHWAMAIDLNSCTGCSACIISCNAENNIPVVGRDEVRRRRELHWMRIDRYFKGNPDDESGDLKMSVMPMLCQQCDNAPCETVCPVLATTHSSEGLNQQTYNRCIGTRYCANNCPYKVRRFNWFRYYENSRFDFNMNDKLGKLVLNPDVTVRARGTMEKCTFCVQRIQESKLKAKTKYTTVADGDIKTACQQSCPADAIVFGNINDHTSEVYKYWMNERAFHALEEVKTLPGIAYMTKVRNIPSTGGKTEHEA